jgi:hypothetical protein
VNASLYPEINQPLPRRVGLGVVPIVVAAIVTVVCGIIAYLSVGIDLIEGRKNEILKTRGVVTQGSIERLRVSQGRRSTTYHVDYLFVPSSKGTTVVRHDEFSSLRRGQSVPVIYDPQDIQRSSLDLDDTIRTADPYRDFWDRSVWYGLILGAGYAASAVLLIRLYRKEKWLLMWGSIAEAKIVEEQEYAIRHARRLAVTYEFADSQGNTVRGTQRDLPTRDTTNESWRDLVKKVVLYPVVLFDPNDNARNILYVRDFGLSRVRQPGPPRS